MVSINGTTSKELSKVRLRAEVVGTASFPLIDNDSLADIVFMCGDDLLPIKSHRAILRSWSNFFAKIVERSLSIQGPFPVAPMIVLKEVPGQDLQDIFKFIYTGDLTIERSRMRSIFKTASFLEITNLVDKLKASPDLKDDLEETINGCGIGELVLPNPTEFINTLENGISEEDNDPLSKPKDDAPVDIDTETQDVNPSANSNINQDDSNSPLAVAGSCVDASMESVDQAERIRSNENNEAQQAPSEDDSHDAEPANSRNELPEQSCDSERTDMLTSNSRPRSKSDHYNAFQSLISSYRGLSTKDFVERVANSTKNDQNVPILSMSSNIENIIDLTSDD